MELLFCQLPCIWSTDVQIVWLRSLRWASLWTLFVLSYCGIVRHLRSCPANMDPFLQNNDPYWFLHSFLWPILGPFVETSNRERYSFVTDQACMFRLSLFWTRCRRLFTKHCKLIRYVFPSMFTSDLLISSSLDILYLLFVKLISSSSSAFNDVNRESFEFFFHIF